MKLLLCTIGPNRPDLYPPLSATWSQLGTVYVVTPLIAITAALALPLSIALVAFAAKRNQAQPIDVDNAAERNFIAALLADPLQWLRVEEVLRAEAFVDVTARRTYEGLCDVAKITGLATYTYRGTDEAAVDRSVERAHGDATLTAALQNPLRNLIAAFETSSSVTVPTSPSANLLDLGSTVLTNAESRDQNTERSPFDLDEVTGTLTRRYVAPTLRRYIITALLGLLAAAVAAQAATMAISSPTARIVAMATILTLLATSVEVALVDLDTFYLDSPFFYISGALGWILAAATNWINHSLSHLIAGVVTALAVAATFEILARVFAKLRGVTQGAGDTWIVLATVGIPAGLVGNWRVGLYSLIAGSITAMLGWVVLRLRGKADATTPLAFGPYLATGWVLALVWFVLAN